MNGQHGLAANERHDSKQISNHSITELLKKDSHAISEKPAGFNVTNIFMLGNNSVNKPQTYHDLDRGRRREIFHEDAMVTRSSSFDGDRMSIFQSPEFSYQSAHPHRDGYTRRAVTPSLPPTGVVYPGLLMSTASHGDTRQRNKYTCRSADNTPLSSPGPLLEKSSSFFTDRYITFRGTDHDSGARLSDFGHDRKVGFEDAGSYGSNGSTPTSPSKSLLKKQRDDGMER